MKKIVYFIVFLIFSACTGTISESGSGRIVGIVADKTTGEPIATVNVILEDSGASTVTGRDGNFSFQNLQVGNYTLLLKKNGYKDVRHIVSVSGSEATESHLLIERIPGLLTLDREELDFGENYSNNTLSFSMVNNNYTPLSWEIIHNCRWIKEINPSQSITPLAFGKTQTVVVVIDRDLLLAGGNETVIVVRTPEGSSNLTVKAYGQERRLAALNILSATEVKASSAILNAELTDGGYPTYSERGFVVSEIPMPNKETASIIIPAPVTQDLQFSAQVNGLILGHSYYVRAYAINSVGTAYSTNQDVFITSAVKPTVKTLDAYDENLANGSVILVGSVFDEGDPPYTERGFVYSILYENPTLDDVKVIVTGSGLGDFEKRVIFNDIQKGVYVRAYAINTKGVAYGDSKFLFNPYFMSFESADLAVQRNDIGTFTWEEAATQCSASRVGNYNDWRLPTFTEISFLYQNRKQVGAFANNAYWTIDYDSYHDKETAYKFKTYYSLVNFIDGSKSTDSHESTHIARCVRTISNYTNPDYYIFSPLNIAIQKQDEKRSSQSTSVCSNSSVGGYHDWRSPTIAELVAIFQIKDLIGGFNYASHDDDIYWSSARDRGVRMSNGRVTHNPYSNLYPVHNYRCVRTLSN